MFRDSTRYVVLVLTIICLTLVLCNSLAYNFTVICLGSENRETVIDFSQTEKGWLFSAVAIGCILGTLPVTQLFERFGMRNVQTAYGMISAVATLLSPCAASQGFYWFLAMRVLVGFGLTVTYPSRGSVTANWSTLKGSGIYMSLLSCHLQFGPMFTMPVAGAFCVSPLGWSGVYYLQGCLTVFFFGLFYYYYRDSPNMHKDVSAKELGKIEDGKVHYRTNRTTPYLTICTDPAVIGCWICWLGGSISFQVFLQYGPTYLNKVLHYEVASTGLATAIPFLLSFLTKLCAGPFSDYATCISEKARIAVFTVASQGTMSACFIILALTPTDNSFIGWLAYTAAVVFSGLNVVGMLKSAQLVSGPFIPFVMAVQAFINSLSMLILPYFVSYMVHYNTHAEWATVFYIICGVVAVTTVFFCAVCKAEPAAWTKEQSNEDDNDTRVNKH